MKQLTKLIIDIGNTTTVFGIFEKEKLLDKTLCFTHADSKKEILEKFKSFVRKNSNVSIESGMIFSVAPSIEKTIISVVKKELGIVLPVFDWKKYEYEHKIPEITDKIGADLIADLLAAKTYYKSPALVFDLGTVTKLLALNEDGNFFGASFIPGMNVALTMFSKRSELLPNHTQLSKAERELGLNTVECMKHGVYWSTVSYIEKQIEINKKSTVILTGGNSVFVKDEFKEIEYDPDLTLKGMNLLFMEAK